MKVDDFLKIGKKNRLVRKCHKVLLHVTVLFPNFRSFRRSGRGLAKNSKIVGACLNNQPICVESIPLFFKNWYYLRISTPACTQVVVHSSTHCYGTNGMHVYIHALTMSYRGAAARSGGGLGAQPSIQEYRNSFLLYATCQKMQVLDHTYAPLRMHWRTNTCQHHHILHHRFHTSL